MATAVVVGVWSVSAVLVVFVQGASRALAMLAADLQPQCCADQGGLGLVLLLGTSGVPAHLGITALQ